MKRLLIIFLLSVLIYSCNILDTSDIRKVYVGMPVKELKSLLNEPHMIKVNQGYDNWFYTYWSNGHKTTFIVRIIDNKVESYYSN